MNALATDSMAKRIKAKESECDLGWARETKSPTRLKALATDSLAKKMKVNESESGLAWG